MNALSYCRRFRRFDGLVCHSVHRRSERRRVLSRTRPLSRRALVRRQNRSVFAGLRPRIVRLGRQARHALARRRFSARRLREISRRRGCLQRPGRRRARRNGRRANARQTLAGQPVLNRAAIVAAGPIANFLLAIVIFTISFAVYGQYVLTPRVGGVEIGSPADLAGFKTGDLIKIRQRQRRSTVSRICIRRSRPAPA